MASLNPIDVVNAKSLEDFTKEYLPDFDSSSKPPFTKWIHPKSNSHYTISLQTATQVSKEDLDVCFELVKSTSMEDYQRSKEGWNSRSKRAEMRLLDLKYFIVKEDEKVKGFASIMPTYEDGYPVVYCYEIHLDSSLQRTGLGSLLMHHTQSIAKNIPTICKIMLTCFTRNSEAMQFYRKLGFEKDEYSPEPRVLRDGRKLEEAYVILSLGV